jgi:two-component sensor histidine kinase
MSNKTVAYESLLKIDSITGDQKAQLSDYRDLMGITVQNYNVSKVRLAEELQVKYATAAKINQIKLLNQKAELEQENLTQANRTKNITIAGIVMVMIIAGLLYRQGANRKKNNEIIIRKNQAMQRLLDEKEWLVKEIHHRVKNNLHTVICLLESQAMYLKNDALQAVENSRHRIYAMSLIHQKLYQSEDIKVVDMKIYLTDFIIYLQESFGSPENISINLSADPIKLGAGQAIPVGLVVNEAVTNAFKYAFPNQSDGQINITLQRLNNKIHLLITDNGIGFVQSDQEASSLGLNLINGLTLDLRGDIVIESHHGTRIGITFDSDAISRPVGHEEVLL